MKVLNVSSGVGLLHHKNVMSIAFIFLLGALGGSSEADRGQFHQEKLYPLHLFFFDCYMLWVSNGALGGKWGHFYQEKVMSWHLFLFE